MRALAGMLAIGTMSLLLLASCGSGGSNKPTTESDVIQKAKAIAEKAGPAGEVAENAAGLRLVTIHNLAYDPNVVQVPLSEAVVWTNRDTVEHTVTSDTGVFRSERLRPGAVFQFAFDTPGRYPYHCEIHGPAMSGVVVVQ